jgi:cell wall-associated NlpC family hydrolase
MRRLITVSLAVFIAVGAVAGASIFTAPEARSATYSQIVDNSNSKRFTAPGWMVSSSDKERYGKNYRQTRPGAGDPARFKVKIPKTGDYKVYARWPAMKDNNSATRFGVSTANGLKWKRVNQKEKGGRWVKLGTYKMAQGDRFAVQVAHNTDERGRLVADAVKVVREESTSDGGGGGGGHTGRDVIKEAKTWLGVPYRYGGTSRSGVDCSGFVMKVYEKFGVKLPRTASDQFYSGPGKKMSKSSFGRGYTIYGNSDGGGVDHAGILTGEGRQMIHAPYPGTVVRTESVWSSYNIVGIKRIFPTG